MEEAVEQVRDSLSAVRKALSHILGRRLFMPKPARERAVSSLLAVTQLCLARSFDAFSMALAECLGVVAPDSAQPLKDLTSPDVDDVTTRVYLFEISSEYCDAFIQRNAHQGAWKMAEADQPDLTTLTVQLLSAYVSNNTVPSADLAGLIQSTRSALAVSAVPAAEPVTEFPPAVSVRKSLGSREHILSLIDGKAYKSLKRHLSTHGLTPAEYRQRYQLPKDYPMVAPGYSQQRREVAERMGLGRKRAAGKAPEAVASTESAAPVAVTKKAPAGTRRTRKPAEVGKSGAETKPIKRVASASASKAAAAATAPAPSAPTKAAPKTKAPTASGAKPRTKAKAAVAAPTSDVSAEKKPRGKRGSAQRKTKEPALAAG